MLTLSNRSAHSEVPIDRDVPAVLCTGLSKQYGETVAVDRMTLEVPQGALVALLGPSGGGKTTVLRLIAGFEVPDAGTIEIAGRSVAERSHFVPPERRRVGMVFQDYALFPHKSVRDNVAFGIKEKESRSQRVSDVLEMVGLADTADRMPHQLSGGQQQRVALARALAPNPAVVLLDEPFSNLDAALRDKVRNEVKQILRDAGTSAVFVTHDQDEAFGLADQIGIMLDATVVQTGRPEEVYLNPNSLAVARFLGEENVLDGEAADGYVTCELGRLALSGDRSLTGRVKVTVRPESLRLDSSNGSGASPSVPAEVVNVEFRGIYKLVYVRLPSGLTLSAVMGLHIPVTVGESVQAAVNSSVSAFPAA
ncbi:MAG: ABC transporter ATP-binding protein [Dehalococcoidia bacterium]